MYGLSLALIGALIAGNPTGAEADDFKREGNPEQRVLKDALEGKAPPALQVDRWMNVDEPLELDGLAGKVVVLDFWGTW